MKKRLIAMLIVPLTVSLTALAQKVEKVTAQQFVDLQQGERVYAGFRRAHAKGICVTGEFVSNGRLAAFSRATIFKPGATPFTGRFSIAGNNPTAPDLKAPVRSLALSFVSSASQQWRLAMNTPPVTAVSNPQSFYQQLQALKAGPEAITAFFRAHPESADFLAWKARYQPTASFATEQYHSINAFYLVDEGGQRRAVRWSFEPRANKPVTQAQHKDALHDELQQRLAQQTVVFDWVFTFAGAGDDENNPAKQWPGNRQRVVVGELEISAWQPQSSGHCHVINFDPLVLPDGIEPTRDPILRARSAAYAESYRRRAWERLTAGGEGAKND